MLKREEECFQNQIHPKLFTTCLFLNLKTWVRINLKSFVTSLIQEGEKISVQVNGQKLLFDKVIVCTGGSPKLEGFDWLKILDHKIEFQPFLFTFNIPENEKDNPTDGTFCSKCIGIN